MYTDNYIVARSYEEELRQIISEIKVAWLDITEEGYIEDSTYTR